MRHTINNINEFKPLCMETLTKNAPAENMPKIEAFIDNYIKFVLEHTDNEKHAYITLDDVANYAKNGYEKEAVRAMINNYIY